MRLVDQLVAGMFLLIAVYLVFSARGTLNTTVTTLGNQVTNLTGVLQGRSGGSGLTSSGVTNTGQLNIPTNILTLLQGGLNV